MWLHSCFATDCNADHFFRGSEFPPKYAPLPNILLDSFYLFFIVGFGGKSQENKQLGGPVSTIDKWAERLYSETDFARSVATSVAGGVGLGVYLWLLDWAIAAFASVIMFPIVRLVAAEFHEKATRRSRQRLEREEAEDIYAQLSEEEKKVVHAFVEAGGSVLTWPEVNRLSLPTAAFESLLHRGLLHESVAADGMRETFVLSEAIFNAGVIRARRGGNS